MTGPAGRNEPWVLFDLGGVVVDVDFGPVHQELLHRTGLPDETLRFLFREAFPDDPQEFGLTERAHAGMLTADAYLAELLRALGPSLDTEALDAILVSIFRGLKTDTVDLIHRLRDAGVPVACFSNTPAVHWRYLVETFEIDRLFDISVCSFQEQVVKPHLRSYARAAERLGSAPEAILFADDRAVNVEGAAAAGMRAHRFTGAAAMERWLAEHGVVAASS